MQHVVPLLWKVHHVGKVLDQQRMLVGQHLHATHFLAKPNDNTIIKNSHLKGHKIDQHISTHLQKTKVQKSSGVSCYSSQVVTIHGQNHQSPSQNE